MNPQLFLQTFWRLELRPQVFVAMSFAAQYDSRFNEIIAPSIRSITVDDVQLEPHRVDTRKSGDCILTQIIDGIAYSQLFLADVSSIGKDSVTGQPYRNANVMYEVGLALACRQPSEVLLIRDDRDKFLFDVSTVPHMTIDFTDKASAIRALRDELSARFKERKYFNDARVHLAIASLSAEEAALLRDVFADLPPGAVWGRPAGRRLGQIVANLPISRLLDKQLIQVVGEFEEGDPAYHPTPLGRVVAQLVKSGLRQFEADSSKGEDTPESEGGSEEDA